MIYLKGKYDQSGSVQTDNTKEDEAVKSRNEEKKCGYEA